MFGEKQKLQAAQLNAYVYRCIDTQSALETIKLMVSNGENKMMILKKIIDTQVADEVHQNRIDKFTHEQLEAYYGKSRG